MTVAEHLQSHIIIITSGQRILTKGRIAILQPLTSRMGSSDFDPI